LADAPLRTGPLSRTARAAATAAWELPWSVYDVTVARLVRMPAIGLTRELQERTCRLVDAGADVVRTSGPFTVLLADAAVRSAPAVTRRLVSAARSERRHVDGQTVIEAVIDGYNAALEPTLASGEYRHAQGRLVNALMGYRHRQRELATMLLRFSDVASRTDVEAVGRTAHELRRELRTLRQQVQRLTDAAAPEPVTNPPARRSPLTATRA
jgi:hypothetical protein